MTSWFEAVAGLDTWRRNGDRRAGRAALGFLEPRLRTMVPRRVKESWPSDLLEQSLQDFLERLLRNPLPEGLEEPERYVARALKNHFIDAWRRERRKHVIETPEANQPAGWEPVAVDQASGETRIAAREQRTRVVGALNRLGTADRVALKLQLAPEWLTDTELEWLAARTRTTPDEVRAAILAADTVYELTLVFDPDYGAKPPDEQARRKRMERFRRRRARARDKLRALLEEDAE